MERSRPKTSRDPWVHSSRVPLEMMDLEAVVAVDSDLRMTVDTVTPDFKYSKHEQHRLFGLVTALNTGVNHTHRKIENISIHYPIPCYKLVLLLFELLKVVVEENFGL